MRGHSPISGRFTSASTTVTAKARPAAIVAPKRSWKSSQSYQGTKPERQDSRRPFRLPRCLRLRAHYDDLARGSLVHESNERGCPADRGTIHEARSGGPGETSRCRGEVNRASPPRFAFHSLFNLFSRLCGFFPAMPGETAIMRRSGNSEPRDYLTGPFNPY